MVHEGHVCLVLILCITEFFFLNVSLCPQCKTNNSYLLSRGNMSHNPYKTRICINMPLIFSMHSEFFLLSVKFSKKKYKIQCNGNMQMELILKYLLS